MGKSGTRGGLAAGLAIVLVIVVPAGVPAGTTEQADLTLTNSDSPDPVVTGTTLTYTIEVTNKGPAAAPDAAMTDNLPGGATVVSATPSAGSCNPNSHKVVCRLDPLPVEATWTIVIAATVTRKKGSMTNAASVQSGVPDPRPGDNSESETTSIAPPPDPPDCEGVESTLFGTEGDDVLTGTANRDVISALGGNDTIDGVGGDDLICGGTGNDSIRARAGNDVIRAKSGDDVARGGDGADVVGGGTGRDSLFGGLRPDRLLGGQGRDTCSGGFGADVKIGC